MNNNLKFLRYKDDFIDIFSGEVIKRKVALALLKKDLGKEGFEAFLALPLNHANSPYISDIIFDPAQPYGVIKSNKNNYWNSYSGFMEDKQKIGDITPILDHLGYIVCNRTLNGEDAYNYILKWLAHLIQKPEEKPRVALAIYSKAQQTGKGIIFKLLMGKILGHMLKTTTSAGDIFGKSNTLCHGSLLTVLDEIGSEKKPHKSLINNVITEKIICMKHNNIPAAQIPTYNRVIHLTNSDNIQDVSEDDSRWVIIKCSDEARDNKRYFKDLANCIENCWYSFFEYLKNFDISDFNPQADRITTEILLDQIDLHKHPVDRFVEAIIDNQIQSLEFQVPQDKSFSSVIGATLLYNVFEAWLDREGWGKSGDISRTMFGIKLSNNKNVQKIKGNMGNAYRFKTF